MKPFLSVVTPTYNRKESLARTLQGLARQTYPATMWECVVVSDGATDGTDEYLKQVQTEFPFTLRPIFQTNGGPARARNHGIAEARGEVVVFLDDDMEPMPDFLERHAAHHQQNTKLGVIGPMLPDAACRDKEPVWIAWEHQMMTRQYDNFQNGTWQGAGPNHFYSGNASVRREHLNAVNGFDETFKRQEDVELAYRMQRERDVSYLFDYQAAGLHRPTRTFEAWLRVPYAYGQLDVERVERGDWEAAMLHYTFQTRQRFTQLMCKTVFACPPLSPLIRATSVVTAQNLYKLHRDSAALTLMSVVYNIRYWEGVALKMGRQKTRNFLRDGRFPTAPQPAENL